MTRRILVVDDDPFIRRLIATTLEDVAGFELVEAQDGAEAVELAADGGDEGVAVEVLVLVEVVADPHAHGVERRRLVGEAGDHDGDHVGVEQGQVFQELQAVVAGAEVPVEDGQVDGVLVGLAQGGLGVGGGEDAAVEVGPLEPLAEGLADRLLVVNDQDGLGRFAARCHHDNPSPQPSPPSL